MELITDEAVFLAFERKGSEQIGISTEDILSVIEKTRKSTTEDEARGLKKWAPEQGIKMK